MVGGQLGWRGSGVLLGRPCPPRNGSLPAGGGWGLPFSPLPQFPLHLTVLPRSLPLSLAGNGTRL